VGSFINKNNTSFDPRNYGFTKLSEPVRKQVYLKVKETTDASASIICRCAAGRPPPDLAAERSSALAIGDAGGASTASSVGRVRACRFGQAVER